MIESMFMLMTGLISYILWKFTTKEQNIIKYHGKFLFYYLYTLFISGLLIPVLMLKPKNARNGRQWHVAKKLTVVAKKELYNLWPFGLACKLVGIIFIDRSQPKAAHESMQAAMHVMQDKKTKIWVFPEGTRNIKVNQFLPFKKGAFAMAVAAQVPIIPIVYSPYYFVNRKKNVFSRGRVIMQCLDPVPTEGLTEKDITTLIETVREKMFSTYKELRKEVINSLPVDYPYPVEC